MAKIETQVEVENDLRRVGSELSQNSDRSSSVDSATMVLNALPSDPD